MPRIIEHRIPSAGSRPYILTFGPDGALWFCESGVGKIGRLDVETNQFQEFALPSADCQPVGIISGPDGNLWFTEYAGHKVARITTDGRLAEFDLPSPNAGPNGITSGPDGRVWFSEADVGQVASVSPDGNVVEVPKRYSRWKQAARPRVSRRGSLVHACFWQRHRASVAGWDRPCFCYTVTEQSATGADAAPERRSMVRAD